MSTAPNGVGEIYFSLDAMLDTRLGTIAKVLGSDAAVAVLSSGYLDSKADVFGEVISEADFKAAYAARDVETLKHSIATPWLINMQYLVESLIVQTQVRPYFSSFRIAVNTYPYQLSESGLVEICDAIKYWTKSLIDIRPIYLSPEELTPQLINNTFVCMVDYDPYTWLNAQAKAFEAHRCPDVTFLAPSIYHQAPPSDEQLKSIDPQIGSPFSAMAFLTKPFIDLVLVKPQFFRMFSPTHKPKQKTTTVDTSVHQ